ncbi:Uncharacterised protein [Mycobacteroides abscessus subsp. massiliense]|nr:Uncharacterised protein [Mycobacteroides abscessus subsp. massiliense]
MTNDLGIVRVPADLVGQRPDQRKLSLENLLEMFARSADLHHTHRQQDEHQPAEHTLDREYPHQGPVAQQPSARNLRCGIGRSAVARRAHHKGLAAQAPPRLPDRCLDPQPFPQRLLVRSECRVSSQTARAQSKVDHGRNGSPTPSATPHDIQVPALPCRRHTVGRSCRSGCRCSRVRLRGCRPRHLSGSRQRRTDAGAVARGRCLDRTARAHRRSAIARLDP